MNTMTIMKKTYIKWCFLGILILLTISLVIYLNYLNSKKTKFLNYPVNYSICNSNEVLVKVYCNRKNLSFLDKDNIVKSNIMDEEQNTYLVKINKISNEKKCVIDSYEYYSYTLDITIPLQYDGIIEIENAKLFIINKKGEEISFNIGNISVANGDFFTLLEVKKIVGMTKNINNYSTLDRIKLELYNFQIEDVILKDIKLISNIVKTDKIECIIQPNKTIELEVPLIYLEDSFIDHMGVLLTWEYQGSIYQQVINPYILFKTSTNHTIPQVQLYEIY